MDGLLKHRKIRRDTSPTPDKFDCDCCKIVDALLTDCRRDVAAGFN